MILKASQRGGGADLAGHLMRADDNEHVALHQLRGFASNTLKDAFKEAEAISRGTKRRQYLFSLSLNPPETARVSVEAFETAIDRIEERLGLDGQPRAVVFHEKEGRRHAHCVWSRIDADVMKARPLPFFKHKLMAVSRDLYLEHGWTTPRGRIEAGARNPTNFTLAEWRQAKRQGDDPRWLRAVVQECWKTSDNRPAFERALQERGLFLARGDRRGPVVLDHSGEVHALARALGLKTKKVRARLGDGSDLASVAETKKTIGARMSPAIHRHINEARAQFQQRSATLGRYKEEMTRLHRKARRDLDQRLEREWQRGTRERAMLPPRGMRGLWDRLTGKYQELRARHEAQARDLEQRQAQERQSLIDQQRAQRAVLQAQFKELRGRQAAQLLDLRQDVGRYFRFTRGESAPAPERTQVLSAAIGLKLDR